MEMRNCPRCGRVFSYMSSPICDACTREEEKIFELVKQYIYDNPNATATQISEATEVSVKKILKYLKDGRLLAVAGMAKLLACETCGTAISTGRYCHSCIVKFNQSTSELVKESQDRLRDRSRAKNSHYLSDKVER